MGFGLIVGIAMALIFYFTQRSKGMGEKSTAVQIATAVAAGIAGGAAFAVGQFALS